MLQKIQRRYWGKEGWARKSPSGRIGQFLVQYLWYEQNICPNTRCKYYIILYYFISKDKADGLNLLRDKTKECEEVFPFLSKHVLCDSDPARWRSLWRRWRRRKSAQGRLSRWKPGESRGRWVQIFFSFTPDSSDQICIVINVIKW